MRIRLPTLALKPRSHQKSETGVSVAPKMDMCPPKNFDLFTFDFLFFQVDPNADPIQISSYDDNIKRWLKYFNFDQFCIIENSDLASNPIASKEISFDWVVKRFLKKSLSFIDISKTIRIVVIIF